jgi:hypothetical protein
VSDFGDYEPEDAWQADDPIAELIDNLFARLDLLDGLPRPGRYGDLLDAIERRLHPWAIRDGLDERTELRVTQLVEDLAFLRLRDEAGDG